MLAQHRAAIGLDLAEGHGFHPRSLKAEAEAADSRKQIENRKFASGCGFLYDTTHDIIEIKALRVLRRSVCSCTAWQKFCSDDCKAKFRWQQKKAGKLSARHCRQCGERFEITSRSDANRWHCSNACSVKSARESRSKFYAKNPTKLSEYRKKSRDKRGPDSNLKRFYARHPDAPRKCQSCGEDRVLDIAHKPEHQRNGAWRSSKNTTLDKVWILCPTCHALLDRMHYDPADLRLPPF